MTSERHFARGLRENVARDRALQGAVCVAFLLFEIAKHRLGAIFDRFQVLVGMLLRVVQKRFGAAHPVASLDARLDPVPQAYEVRFEVARDLLVGLPGTFAGPSGPVGLFLRRFLSTLDASNLGAIRALRDQGLPGYLVLSHQITSLTDFEIAVFTRCGLLAPCTLAELNEKACALALQSCSDLPAMARAQVLRLFQGSAARFPSGLDRAMQFSQGRPLFAAFFDANRAKQFLALAAAFGGAEHAPECTT